MQYIISTIVYAVLFGIGLWISETMLAELFKKIRNHGSSP